MPAPFAPLGKRGPEALHAVAIPLMKAEDGCWTWEDTQPVIEWQSPSPPHLPRWGEGSRDS